MPTEIVIPQGGIAGSKMRLSPVLTDSQRRALVTAMLARVIRIALEIAPVSVVSPTRELEAVVVGCGARFVLETWHGLNGALEQARGAVLSRGVDTVAVLHADLPQVTSTDVAALVSAVPSPWGVAIAPDLAGVGTNAMAVRSADPIPYRFGLESCRAHSDEAGRAGIPVRLVSRRGLAFDLDTPEDLREYICSEESAWLRHLLGAAPRMPVRVRKVGVPSGPDRISK